MQILYKYNKEKKEKKGDLSINLKKWKKNSFIEYFWSFY